MDILVPHFRFPFDLVNGAVATVEQDTPEEINQCVAVLLATEQGERLEVLDYGVAGLLFATDLDHHAIGAQIERWEPRALAGVSDEIDGMDVTIRTLIASVTQGGV
jgi:phage baseplate assembly protein W